MDAKLLEKIEELSLYILQQQQQNNAQNGMIDQLKKQNEQQQQQMETLLNIVASLSKQLQVLAAKFGK
jgi:hypothetical protein